MNKRNLQTDKVPYLAGDFRSYVEGLARHHIADTFSANNDASPETIATQMVSSLKRDANYLSSLHGNNHLSQTEDKLDRLVEIAQRSNDAPMHYQSPDDVLARANWDFSNEVNRQYSLVMYDYMATHGFDFEPSKMKEVIAKHITEPISQMQMIQQAMPAKLMAAVELKSSLDTALSAQERGLERYAQALQSEGTNKAVLDYVAVDAQRVGIEMPESFNKLRHCVSDIHSTLGATDAIELPNSAEKLGRVFEAEGVESNFSLVSQSNAYIASIPSVREVDSVEISSPSMH